MNWDRIRTFLAVAEAGTLAAAAERLALSQPTVGRQIDALEAETGLTLFVRGRQGMMLTEAGLSLVAEARAMRREADRFALKVAGRAGAVRGSVRITASEVMSTYVLPQIVAAFCEVEPDIQVELVSSNSVENLTSRDADIAVRMVRPVQNDLIARKAGDLEMGIYAHRRYLERHGEPTDIDSFFRHRLIGMDRATLIIDGMARLGFHVGRDAFAVRTDDQVAYWELVRAGAGIGFAPRLLAARDPEIRRILPDIAIPALPVWLASHRELRTSERIRRTMDFLYQAVVAAPLDGETQKA